MGRSITPFEEYGEPSPESDSYLTEYVFRSGDTISGLADRFYNDWRLWRPIADRNRITDVRRIAVGTRLLIPPKPMQRGRYESEAL
ncbi:MAG TPA: LysM peptidoglycan-binding domain-containing protein [Pyrinomonadaceae bacterium]|jgi:nucleoid-associated protein YgaU|nr:LysM peptidoglycan-binding domain-containing protein [Pyrinomonadaceae bacterium]